VPAGVNCIPTERLRGWAYNECEDDVADVPLSARHGAASLLLRLMAVEQLVLLGFDSALHLVGCQELRAVARVPKRRICILAAT
jgi:hypothetical protein